MVIVNLTDTNNDTSSILTVTIIGLTSVSRKSWFEHSEFQFVYSKCGR